RKRKKLSYIYNAGAGVRADNSTLNQTPKDQLSKINETIEARSKAKFSSIKYELKNQTDKEIKDSILSINEIEAIKAHNNEINRFKSEQFINPTANSRRTVTGQTLGNCSSRSIREALRDNVPDSEFREIYYFITQNQVSQIISNLESEQKNLADILNIPLIKEQSISNTTY
ncbi:MAG: hypothetical protein AB8U80_01410, partial [Rickettsia conorii subsp. raoultii]|uniref:hypothetical protein n=1 Tax=Rickettsia conorii TaxID=781 RepID=UPI003AF16218